MPSKLIPLNNVNIVKLRNKYSEEDLVIIHEISMISISYYIKNFQKEPSINVLI